MTAATPNETPAPGPPSPEAVEAFCQYLRLLELEQEAEWEGFCKQHAEHEVELRRLLEEYERVTSILDALAPAASFSARLRAHYGDSVDPGISLSGDDRPSRPGSSSTGSGATTGRVLARLVAQSPHTRRYEPRREIARGGMGAILEVWDGELRRTLAMKVVLTGRSGTTINEESADVAERRLSRFLEEAQITGQLDHPGIVPVHDIGLDDQGRVYFTMQLIDGLDLRKVFELARLERDGWNHHRAVSVLIRVCEAVAFAHSKGVVHRDLKPANIMVGRFGEAYVMDWGLAKVLGREDAHDIRLAEQKNEQKNEQKAEPKKQGSRRVKTDRSDEDTDQDSALKTLDGDIVGTPAYMAPEQARGKLDEIGPRSDVYSMGAMLYHLLSGHMPYEPLGEKVPAHTILDAVRKAPPWPLQQLNPDVDGELGAICEMAMAREPATRYGDMMALGEDLRAWVEGRGVGAYTTGVFYETRKWMARNRATTMALGAVLVLVLMSISLFIWQQQRSVWKLAEEKKETAEALEEARIARADADEQRRSVERNAEEMRKERDRADAQTRYATKQTELATEEAKKSAQATQNALESENLALANAYRLSINAASYSLRLDEVSEAKRNLVDCRGDLRGWEWYHLDLAKDRSVSRIVQEYAVTDLSSSEDGGTILTYGAGLPPRLWSIATRKRITELEGVGFLGMVGPQRGNLLRADLSADGALAVVTRPDRRYMQLYNTGTGQLLNTWQSQESSFMGVEFNRDGTLIAAASRDGTAEVFDTLNGRAVCHLVGHTGEVGSIAFSADSARVVTGGEDGTARVFEVESGEELALLKGQHAERITSVDWSPDGTRIATASEDHSLAIWSASSGVLLAGMHGHDGAVLDVAFTADGEHLISGSSDRTVRMWDVATGRQERVFHGHDGEVRTVACLGKDGLVASGSLDTTVRVWDTLWDPASTLLEPEGNFLGLAFAPSSHRLYAVPPEGSCLEIDADAGLIEAYLGTPVRDRGANYWAIGASSDGRLLAISRTDRKVELWDPKRGELVRVLDGFERAVTGLDFSEDGQWLALGTEGKKASVERLDGSVPRVVIELRRNLTATAIHPDGSMVATAESDNSLRLWGLPDREPLAARRDAHSQDIMDIAFDSSGEFLATVSKDRRLRVWTTGELEKVLEGEGHENQVSCVDFSPTEPRLVTGSVDGTLRVWNRETGHSMVALRGHTAPVWDVKFSPDGSRIASCGSGTGIRLWESNRVEARYQRRLEALDLHRHARELIEDLYGALRSKELVEDAVIDDVSLDPALKRAARVELRAFEPETEEAGENSTTPGERR